MQTPSKRFVTGDPWTVLTEDVVFSDTPWIELRRQSIRLPAGRVVDDYYQIEIPDFVTVLAITDKNEAVCLRQYKHGAREQCLSFPGGMVDDNETSFKAAQRELLEETGFSGGNWIHLGSLVVNGNSGICKGHFFIAKGVIKTSETTTDADLEDMTIDLLPVTNLRDHVITGGVRLLNHAAVLGLASLFGEI